VFALTVFGGELIAGGQFTGPGNGIARWNGASWQQLAGLRYSVLSVIPYEGDLIAGGNFFPDEGSGFIFSRVARWNGTSWQTMDTGMNNSVHSLAVFGDQLIASGDFSLASNEPANRIARWAPCPGDVVEDEVVNVDDLLIVISLWGNPGALGGIADVNLDGFVNVDDLLAVINGWGPCP